MGFISSLIRLIKSTRKQRLAFDSIFKNFDSAKPKLKIHYSYGYPAFIVTFRSKEDMDKAENAGLIKQFSARIQEICQLPSGNGTETWSFDAERAIYSTYEGEEIPRIN